MSTSALSQLENVPLYSLGNWPTPLDQFVTEAGPLQIKRDDLSGFCRGGAKTRKLEVLIKYLQDKQYTDLIVVVGNITNLAFDLVDAFKQLDIKHHIYIIDDPVANINDRTTFFRDIFDQVHILSKSRCNSFFKTISKYSQLRMKGKKPFLLFPGASHPCSIIGNALGLLEYVKQSKDENFPVCSHLYISLATGTSSAGFVLAAALLRDAGYKPIQVMGVNVYSKSGKRRLKMLLKWTTRFLGIQCPTYEDLLQVDNSELAGGFAQYHNNIPELAEKVKENYHIDIDPVFGAKTWAVMENKMQSHQNTLFWHCGYTPEWQLLGQKQV